MIFETLMTTTKSIYVDSHKLNTFKHIRYVGVSNKHKWISGVNKKKKVNKYCFESSQLAKLAPALYIYIFIVWTMESVLVKHNSWVSKFTESYHLSVLLTLLYNKTVVSKLSKERWNSSP